MKIGIMQPYFFPYLGYFQLISSCDTFVIYDRVSFRKKGWIARNRILDAGNGLPVNINVPLKSQSSNKLISEIRVDNDKKWQEKLLQLVYYNYKRAVHFDDIFSFLKSVLNVPFDFVTTLNSVVIRQLCDFLDVKTRIVYEEEQQQEIEQKLLKNTKKEVSDMTARVIEVCKVYGATTYINPPGGQQLYKTEDFELYNMDLRFIQPNIPSYAQFKFDHVPNLSILDCLMHMGIEKTKDVLANYKMVSGE
ncbi:MAG: WbqC family protein [Cyclobacteriaceae bacterium]